jgi:quercetin dioxygenase-like cupin family protein
VNSWELGTIDLKPRLPEILSSSDAARAIVLDLAADESLLEHEVHERSWLVVLGGEIEVAAAAGERASGGAGLLVEFAPGERHEVVAAVKARLLLLLTPWPGSGPPRRDDDPREAIRPPTRRQAGGHLNEPHE